MRKDLNWMWIFVIPFLIVLPLATPTGGNLLMTMALPFTTAGTILRNLSLSGGMGNLAAIGLYGMLCIAPLLLIRKGDGWKVNGLLVLGSAVMFWVMWLMVNPGLMPATMRNDVGKAIYAGAIYSVMITWGVLKLMTKADMTVKSGIYSALRLFLMICAGQFLFVGLGLSGGEFKGVMDALFEENTALSDSQLMPTLLFITLDFSLSLLENLMIAWILLLATRLLDALEADPYSELSQKMAGVVFSWCKKAIPLVAVANLILNLGQVLFASVLVHVNLQLRIPAVSLAVAFGMMALSRLIGEGKAIKDDNDLFI